MAEAWGPYFRYHVEHIVALQHGGNDSESNLAFACNHCNLIKGPNLTSIDPDSGAVTRLFNPRAQSWDDHFAGDGDRILGLTGVGRTTVFLLQMNAQHRAELRHENMAQFDRKGPSQSATSGGGDSFRSQPLLSMRRIHEGLRLQSRIAWTLTSSFASR